MVVTAALISLVALAAAPDQPPPYTVSGVRRAAAEAGKPIEGAATPDTVPAPLPARSLARAARQQLDVGAWLPPPPPVALPRDDRFVTASLDYRHCPTASQPTSR